MLSNGNIDWNALSASHYAQRFQICCALYIERAQDALDAEARGDELAAEDNDAIAAIHFRYADAMRGEFDLTPIEEG